MNTPGRQFAAALAAAFALSAAVDVVAQPAAGSLPHTAALTRTGDFSADMVAGIGRFLDRETAASVAARAQFWRPDFTSRAAYENSVATNRARLARRLGVVDARVPANAIEFVASDAMPARIAETEAFTIDAVRWGVFGGVHAEGLWLRPKRGAIARVVALPDADQTPETIGGIGAASSPTTCYARRLAESGCEVLVPTLVDRADTFSGNPQLGRFTNQPHREWIYRPAFELGRHVIGYEVQEVLAAVDHFARENAAQRLPIGVVGWGEGGLLALHAAALDPRIDAALVSGYFGPREQLWREPIYRNVFGLLTEFGDAEVAQLIVPRTLLVEHAVAPAVAGPPPVRSGRAGAAPGRIDTPDMAVVRAEVARAQSLAGPFASAMAFRDGSVADATPLGEATLGDFVQRLCSAQTDRAARARPDRVAADPVVLADARRGWDPAARQERQVREFEAFTQSLLRRAAGVRDEFFWKKLRPSTPAQWREATRAYREKLWTDVIGRVPLDGRPLNAQSRVLREDPRWVAHEVTLDVLPDIFAWGYLLLPRDLKPGEKRPVVVMQHGLEGLPSSVMEDDPQSRAFAAYKAVPPRLAERGFIVFAPHTPYRGEDAFRVLQRKANPLGKSLFSIIIAQHERILEWLAALPNVDPERIAFYGLSYGGKTAMRVPAVLERYALSICSGDFNEWIWKNATTDWPGSYVFTKEWEMPEFDLGSTFGYAEMAALIAPRPFMVERGHDDGVALDEWVTFEYAKVRRLYDRLQIPERTQIEFFAGPHTIHGVGTFAFLHRELRWPEPGAR